MPYQDDPTIRDEEVLWRRANADMFDKTVDGEELLQSWAFKDPKDTLSVDIASETSEAEVLAAGHPGQRIVGITAGFVRELGYTVARDPEPNDPAHALIIPKPGKTKKEKHLDRQSMALRATWTKR